jgi:hypothetical protein
MGTSYTTKSGVELELQPVSQEALRNLFSDAAFSPIFENPTVLEQDGAARVLVAGKSPSELMRVSGAATRLFNYCIGWGVKTDPDEESLHELRALGFEIATPRVARVNWLRYIELDGQDEAGELIGAILTLSYGGDEEPEEDEAALLRARLAELEG